MLRNSIPSALAGWLCQSTRPFLLYLMVRYCLGLRSGFFLFVMRRPRCLRIEVGRRRFGHGVTAQIGSVLVAHHSEHVGNRHLAPGFGGLDQSALVER